MFTARVFVFAFRALAQFRFYLRVRWKSQRVTLCRTGNGGWGLSLMCRIDALFFFLFFLFFFEDHLQATCSRCSSSPKRNVHNARFRSMSPLWFVFWHVHNSTSLIFRLDNLSVRSLTPRSCSKVLCDFKKPEVSLRADAWRLLCFHCAKGCWGRTGKAGKSPCLKHSAPMFWFTFGVRENFMVEDV